MPYLSLYDQVVSISSQSYHIEIIRVFILNKFLVKITVLDMQYYIRPDRVYATSVLAPTTQGYQPVRSVMKVAQQFTEVLDPGGRGLAGTMENKGIFGRIKDWLTFRKMPMACVCPNGAISVEAKPMPGNVGIIPPGLVKIRPGNTGIVPPSVNPSVLTPESAGLSITQASASQAPPLLPAEAAAIQTAPNAALTPSSLANAMARNLQSNVVQDAAALLAIDPFYSKRSSRTY